VYKDLGTDVGCWLSGYFGMSFVKPQSVADVSQDARCLEFADYVLDNYIEDGATFPPVLWSEEPSDRRTNN
jgi:hypothetical protein